MEHNAFENLGVGAALISPELTRSSLWLSARMVAALSPSNIDTTLVAIDQQEDRTRFEEAMLLPHIPIVSSSVLQQIIDFILSKVFAILTKLPGEVKYVFFVGKKSLSTIF